MNMKLVAIFKLIQTTINRKTTQLYHYKRNGTKYKDRDAVNKISRDSSFYKLIKLIKLQWNPVFRWR